MTRVTHEEKVLALLNDGQPHTHHEIYALYVIGHSRISGLKNKGFGIEHWQEGQTHWYQLVSRPLAESGQADPGVGLVPTSPVPDSASGCVSDVLPTHEAPRVEASVTAPFPRPLNSPVLPSGQLTLQWAA